jgi:hypothetical protein
MTPKEQARIRVKKQFAAPLRVVQKPPAVKFLPGHAVPASFERATCPSIHQNAFTGQL